MAVGAIGNTIFVNQMTPTVSSVQNAHNNRVDVQNMMAQANVNEKDEKVLEVRPAEENHKINSDREHTKEDAEQETKRNPKQEVSEEELQEEQHFKLDIKV